MRIKLLDVLAACALAAVSSASSAVGQDPRPGAPAPRLPVDPNLGVNSGKPDLGGKGMWDIPYITDMSKASGTADNALIPSGLRLGGVMRATNVPFKPEAKKIFDQRAATLSKDDPEGQCLPPGVPRVMYTPHPMEFLQLPNRIVIIYEIGTLWRNIWMDGRQHPKDPNPTYLGDSIGHWEGDTLVVDVTGFNALTWLEYAGHPHGEKLHVIEKYSRPDLNTLHYEATIDDPEYYTEPWTVPMNIPWVPGQELSEYVCLQNNRDLEHLVGK